MDLGSRSDTGTLAMFALKVAFLRGMVNKMSATDLRKYREICERVIDFRIEGGKAVSGTNIVLTVQDLIELDNIYGKFGKEATDEKNSAS